MLALVRVHSCTHPHMQTRLMQAASEGRASEVAAMLRLGPAVEKVDDNGENQAAFCGVLCCM